MEISKWTTQVVSGPLEPVYVYPAPIRFWHWTQAVIVVLQCITGFLIGWPPLANYAKTWATFSFAHIITVHLVCGMIFVSLTVYRIYWAFAGNKYCRMIFILPIWDKQWYKGLFNIIGYYLFLNDRPNEYVGHNPLAQLAMFLMYVIGSILICITGLGLFSQQWGWGTGWMKYFGWVTTWLGSVQTVRTFHHLLLYNMIIYIFIHIYMCFREDIMGGETQLSTMANGIRAFKHPAYSAQAIAEAAPHFPAIHLEKAKMAIEKVGEEIEGTSPTIVTRSLSKTD